jgi:hypothetical protein
MPPKTTQKAETKTETKVAETKVAETKNVKQQKPTEPKTVKTETKSDSKAVNQQTASAGLTLSVTAFKAWMKEYIGQPVKFSGGHIVLTAVNETLWRYLIEQALKEVAKDNAGLYTLTRPSVRNTVLLNQDLNLFFGPRFEQYDQDMKYGSQYCITHKVVTQFINEECGKNVNYDDQTYHLLVFLLLKASSTLTTASYKMMQYAGRKSIDDRAVLTALELYFGGDLLHLLRVRAEEAVTCAGEAGKDENDDDTSQPSEKTDPKPATKQVAKGKTTKVEVAEEEEEVAEEEEEVAEEEEEQQEEEEEVEPTPPPKKVAGKASKK